MKRRLYLWCSLVVIPCLIFISCRTVPKGGRAGVSISRSLTGKAVMSADNLASFFLYKSPDSDVDMAHRMAVYYVKEASDEGINSDVAFAQMCLETGFLHFGNLVTADMHNYCGLGSIGAGQPGERFDTEQMGVRAHIQHLNAYGDTDDLHHPLIDARYRFVTPRGKAPDIFHLAGTWAQDTEYGNKIDRLLCEAEELMSR